MAKGRCSVTRQEIEQFIVSMSSQLNIALIDCDGAYRLKIGGCDEIRIEFAEGVPSAPLKQDVLAGKVISPSNSVEIANAVSFAANHGIALLTLYYQSGQLATVLPFKRRIS